MGLLTKFKRATGIPQSDLMSISRAIELEAEATLSEARAALGQADEPLAAEVARAGFVQAENIWPAHAQQWKKTSAEKQLTYSKDYADRYPFNKFIADEVVRRLLAKSRLHLSDARFFIGRIPVQNQVAITEFRVLGSDRKMAWSGNNWYQGSEESIDRQIKEDGERREAARREFAGHDTEMCPAYDLKVLAPKADFAPNDDCLVWLSDESFPRVALKDDPVVLQPVHGGYLIVTAWNKEETEKLN